MIREMQRFTLLFKRFSNFSKILELGQKVTLNTPKLYQASNKYWSDTDKVKVCFPCGRTNKAKQCVLTMKAINTYRPIEFSSKNKTLDFKLSHVNEIFALHCGFSFFSNAFARKFFSNEDFIYLLESSEVNYEQLMIILNIFYKDYTINGN